MKKFIGNFTDPTACMIKYLMAVILLLCVINISCRKQAVSPLPGTAENSFINACFRASHNSYSGNQNGGHRGSIKQQLDAGLRFVEFDIRTENGSFLLGHGSPGDEVFHSCGNPGSNNLQDWIHIVANWSRHNSSHIPVILMFDMKNFFSASVLVDLNQIVKDSLKNALMKSNGFNPNSTLDSLAGRVLVVLSGNESSRDIYSAFKNDSLIFFVEYQMKDNSDNLKGELFYAADASGDCGWAQQAHQDGKFVRLWDVTNGDCQNPAPNLPATNEPFFGWYGRYSDAIQAFTKIPYPKVSWKNPVTHDKGIHPDVAINRTGYVVEVHQSNNYHNELWYNTGKLSTDGNSIIWYTGNKDERNYDTGIEPTVAINDSLIVIEVHKSENTNELYHNIGKLNTNTHLIDWIVKSQQHDEGFLPNVAINENNVIVEVHRGSSSNNLWYNVGKFNGSTIQWGDMGDYRLYTTGNYPSVAVNGTNVFEMHASSTEYLWSIIGQLDENNFRIDWKGTDGDVTYAYPCEQSGNTMPCPALNETCGLEVHISYHSGIWWSPCKQSNSLMAMGASKNISGAYMNPLEMKTSLDMNEETAIMIYCSGEEDLIYFVGKLNSPDK